MLVTIPENPQKYLDFINVMTYDMHGSWDGYADHHSKMADTAKSLMAWHKKGAPKHKLVVGIPFYARYLFKPFKKATILASVSQESDQECHK